MAQVRLIEPDRPGYELPMVCVECGAPATTRVGKSFAWHPPWVGFVLFSIFVTYGLGIILYILVAMAFTKRARLHVPLCAFHRKHWFVRTLVVAGFFVLVVVGFAAIILTMNRAPGEGGLPLDTLLFGWLVFLGVWAIVALAIRFTTIRPTEITDDTVMLKGVAPAFVAACLAEPHLADLGPVEEDDDD